MLDRFLLLRCLLFFAISLFQIQKSSTSPLEDPNFDLNAQLDAYMFKDRHFTTEPKQDITRYPVVLIPGDGGNQIHAKLNKTSAPHYFCKLKSSYFFELWLNLEEISPYVIDCFVDNLRLVYNTTTKQTDNSPGVQVQVQEFGNTATVEYLDSSRYAATAYFGLIVDALVKKYGYVRGLSVRGAPYDWRKAPNELAEFYENFTKLVEDTYYKNNNTQVMLMAHSMGNPVTLYWLNNLVTQAWKDKFIRMLVSISAPWGGAAKTLRLMASGDNVDIIVVRPIRVRAYQRTAPSTAFLMPSDRFWASDEVIVTRPERNYTVNDYEDFFKDLNFTDGFDMRQNTKRLVYEMQPPNVEIVSFYGVDVKTPDSFSYSAKMWPDSQPNVVYGNGDGTVNIRSLLGYRQWIGKQSQPISFKEFSGVEHVATLRYQPVIDSILQLFYQ